MLQAACQQPIGTRPLDPPRRSGQSPWFPVEPFPTQSGLLSRQAEARWLWAFLTLGLVLRVLRYLLRFPVWEDEAMLATNYVDRGYLGLLQPLNYGQVGAPLFLWGQLTVVKLFGFTEYTLRLVPFACSVASLGLFGHLARRLLRGTALVLAVGLFSVGYPMIRYAAEAKPYGCDLLLALGMLTLLVEWLYGPGENRWLWGLAALTPLAVGHSYPAVFTAGGISLVSGYVLWSSGRRGWRPWLAFNLVLVASFLVLLWINSFAVGESNLYRMKTEHWGLAFPPITRPLELPGWLWTIHAGSMLAYPVGGPGGGSTLTLLGCLLGVAVLARRRQGLLLAMFLAPLALNFIAAAMHCYPYGGHMKLGLYDAAAFCMLPAVGVTALLGPSADRRPRARAALFAVLGVLMAVGFASLLRDLTHPYKSGTTLRARDFARWFWFDLTHDGELLCMETDLKQNLSPGTFEWGWSSLYLCNQRIYSPRHVRGEPPRLERVSADWPLRCVLYRSAAFERDRKALDHWLQTMTTRYDLVAHDKYPFAIYDKWDKQPRGVDFIEVFKFVPNRSKSAEANPPLSLREGRDQRSGGFLCQVG